MSKNLRRSTLLLAAVFVMIVMAVPAFATTYYTSGEAAYTTQDIDDYKTTAAVTVTLRIQSRKTGSGYNDPAIDETYSVTVPASSTPRAATVSQVLYYAMQSNSGLYFKNYAGNNISSNSDYVYSVVYNNNTYAPVDDGHYIQSIPVPWNGWMVTVNGKYVLKSGTTPATGTLDSEYGDADGRSINNTYVANGDVVTFFYNDANSHSAADDVLRIQSASYDSSTQKFSVNVESSRNWYANYNSNTIVWHITDYAPVQSATVQIYNSNGTRVAYGTTDSSGLAYLSATGTITSGTYTVKTTTKYAYRTYTGGTFYFLRMTHTEETLTI